MESADKGGIPQKRLKTAGILGSNEAAAVGHTLGVIPKFWTRLA